MKNDHHVMERNRSLTLLRFATFATLALLLLAGGCATRDPSSVDSARVALQSAREGGLVDSDSLDFREAERHLSQSEELLEDKEDQKLIDHEAEMAGLYAQVAVARTEAIAARAESEAYVDRARIDTATTRVAVELAIQNARNIDARQTERGLVLTLGGVLFDFDSADLTSEARLSVARVAGFLIALDDRDAVVEGHADNTGKGDYNLGLSKRRAESIRDALFESGVAEGRLAAEGYGDRFPIASNDTAEGRERNRRVEIVILRPGLSAAEAHR
jgi:outer membrane protein OmpA-like peptidoglycan-associated protein